jgi:hypothetical protein
MPSIVYQTDKRSGSTYAYRSTSFRDPDTGRPRSRREYLGRVDPATGEIVPKAGGGRRNRSKVGEPEERADAGEVLRALRYRDDELARLEGEVARLSGLVGELRERNALLESAIGAVAADIAGLAPSAP